MRGMGPAQAVTHAKKHAMTNTAAPPYRLMGKIAPPHTMGKPLPPGMHTMGAPLVAPKR